jgi:hypothetical protein
LSWLQMQRGFCRNSEEARALGAVPAAVRGTSIFVLQRVDQSVEPFE